MRTATHHRLRRLLPAATLLAVVGAGPIVRAQDDDEDAPEPENVPQVVQPAFALHENQFDQWVFNGRFNASSARAGLESILALHVEEVDRACGLTADQKQKLLLAGRGDIKRFFDRVDDKRRKLQAKTYDRNRINEIFQEIQPLQVAFNAGLFGEGSLLAKTLAKTLGAEQAERYSGALRDKRAFRYHAKVALAVATLGDGLGLDTEQRRRFSQVLMAETRPPRSFGQLDYYAVLLHASRVPEAQLKPIFDDAQWRLLSRQLDRARSLERTLRARGYVPDDDAAESGARRPNDRGPERPAFHFGPPAGAVRRPMLHEH